VSISLLLLGLWTLDDLMILVMFLGPSIKLWRFLKREAFVPISWESPIKLWRFLKALCGFVTTLKDHLVDQGLHFDGKGSRRIHLGLCGVWCALSSTVLQRRIALAKVL
jgi:hypothetical protein